MGIFEALVVAVIVCLALVLTLWSMREYAPGKKQRESPKKQPSKMDEIKGQKERKEDKEIKGVFHLS